MKASDIRSTFLDYFDKNDHQVIGSSSLVPENDPTLMFTNAGMVQFKNLFTGLETRDYKRAVTSQKCVRAGGKHNDLENVGYTARHHTFFEMLGNFSFGDYFKENAIELAWNLLTKEFGLDKDKLLVTVYHDDEEAKQLWKKIAGLSNDKIIPISTLDNFWSMGDTGPCGPCTEIFYDHGEHISGGVPGSADEDGDRFIEIWNLVFMQFEQSGDGTRENLPSPSIDTGMGLERLATILQGKHNNYDIDMIRSIIEHTAGITGGNPDNVSFKVIADHLRSASFLIADGVLPSNEGRGYVLRRIMRRAMRHAHILGAKDPLMHQLVPSLVTEMGSHFGELGRAQSLITETLKSEEVRFKETLDRGLKLLEGETDKLGDGETLKGEVAFTLYDTFGFPLDLTEDILRGQGRNVDLEGFNSSMEQQKQKARAAWAGSGASKTDNVWFDVRDKSGATEFLGYEMTEAQGVVVNLVKDSELVSTLSLGEEGVLITNQTPFYGESGGQVGDTGIITSETALLRVTNTQKAVGDLFLHYIKVEKGSIAINDALEMIVDKDRRNSIIANHSVTHLLHEALRNRLGDHVSQKGSLQSELMTRFDVAQPTALTDEDIVAVEQAVNAQIRSNTVVVTRIMTPDEGRDLGAAALFGEKYGDEVRVVSMGTEVNDGGKAVYSVELCGGIHVKQTGEIGGFKIISESAVASGVRRIEAITGVVLEEYTRTQEKLLRTMSSAFKSPVGELPSRVVGLQNAVKTMEKEMTDLRRKLAGSGASKTSEIEVVSGVNFIGKVVELPAKELKGLAEELRNNTDGDTVIALVSVAEGKASIVVASSSKAHSAVDLVKIGSACLGGQGGGGRPDMAQAGGADVLKANEAIIQIKSMIL